MLILSAMETNNAQEQGQNRNPDAEVHGHTGADTRNTACAQNTRHSAQRSFKYTTHAQKNHCHCRASWEDCLGSLGESLGMWLQAVLDEGGSERRLAPLSVMGPCMEHEMCQLSWPLMGGSRSGLWPVKWDFLPHWMKRFKKITDEEIEAECKKTCNRNGAFINSNKVWISLKQSKWWDCAKEPKVKRTDR